MILISILGDFDASILPVFYNFKDKITTHVLVYDDAKKDSQNAQGINIGMDAFAKKNSFSFLALNYKLDEDSMPALERCANYILALTDNPNEIYINTTDGYSTLTTVLNHKLFNKGVNFIAYDRYDNQYNILNQEGLQTKNMGCNLDISDHFLLRGYTTETTSAKEFAEKNQETIIKIFEQMIVEYDAFVLLDQTKYPTVGDLSGKHESIKKAFLEMDASFSTLSINNALLKGALFECYIYLLVKDMKYDDIEVGIQVFKKYKNSYIKNEFDILIMKDNHLHMIECKYKNYIKVDELVYKYMALAPTIDEDGKMAIVTKKAPNYDDEIEEHRMKGLSYKRGRLSNIYFYGAVYKNKSKFQEEIKSLFTI